LTDLSKSPARIAGMFDAIAARYDFLNHLLSAGIDRRWRRRAVRSLALRGHERVLDVCTGTADLAIASCDAVPSARRVVGLDFAQAMLEIGRGKVRRRGLERRVSLVRADALSIPVKDGAVDGITIGFGIRNVADRAAACLEMRRVLAPGGRLAILEFAMPSAPLLKTVYSGYFNHVLPFVGRFVSGHRGAYAYLPASVGDFGPPDEFAALLRQHGFGDVAATKLTFGIVYLYTARRE
jgi:demethylmenaquinone methyltransferase/2-methoxy-6-polyprenyl-1,4-benzoquinol methylase